MIWYLTHQGRKKWDTSCKRGRQSRHLKRKHLEWFPLLVIIYIHTHTLNHTLSLFLSLDNIILEDLEEYSLITPTSTDSEGRFLSNVVSGVPKRRFRRDTGDLPHEAASEHIFYNVTVFGREFHCRLRPNSRLVAPGAVIEWQEDSNVTSIEPLHGNCLYVGDIMDLPNASVAISNCDGLVRCFALIYLR